MTEVVEIASVVDFDAEGRKLGATGEFSIDDADIELCNYDEIWRHPTTQARLLVGNLRAALNREVLKRENIKGVVTCTQDLDPRSKALYNELAVDRFHYSVAFFHNRPQKKLAEGAARFFAPMLGWVKEALDSGKTVLIHCLAGAHRAGATAVACLMFLDNLTAAEATAKAQAARDCIDPGVNNCGLDKLLRKLERSSKTGLLGPAVEEARKLGYADAFDYLFSFRIQFLFRLGCWRRRPLEAQDDIRNSPKRPDQVAPQPPPEASAPTLETVGTKDLTPDQVAPQPPPEASAPTLERVGTTDPAMVVPFSTHLSVSTVD